MNDLWTSDERMSNTSYHAAGKPTWWARIGSRFLEVGRQRGDSHMTIDRGFLETLREESQKVIIEYGVGRAGEKGSVRGKITLSSNALG